jgi:hypothetical protein
MAITKMGTYRNPPEDITDYEAMVEKLDAYARTIGGQGMILTEWTNANEWPKLAMGSYIFHGGASYIVDTEDYTIGEPSDGTYYLRVMASGETLTVSWISSLDNYTWNPIYNGLYHPDQSQILPYQLVVSGATKEKWKITNLAQGSGFIRANWQGRIVSDAAINVSHVNTGDGNFKIGQNLRTTDSVYFNGIGFGIRTWDEGIPYVQRIINAKAGTQIVASSDKVVGTGGTSYTKRKELVSFCTGTVSVTFSIRGNPDNRQYGATARVYKNGVAIGAEKYIQGDTYGFDVVTDNFSVAEGDLIQLYGKSDVSGKEGSLKEFRIMTLRGFIA